MGLKHPGLMLKYSTFKNLASMSASREDLETAMEFYLEVKQCQFDSLSVLALHCFVQVNVFFMHMINTVVSVHTIFSALFFS